MSRMLREVRQSHIDQVNTMFHQSINLADVGFRTPEAL